MIPLFTASLLALSGAPALIDEVASQVTIPDQNHSLDVVEAILVPTESMLQMVEGGFATTWRARIEAWPETVALEKAYPGVVDTMVNAGRSAAVVELKARLAALKGRAGIELTRQFSPPELSGLAAVFEPMAQALATQTIDFSTRDNAATAAKRSLGTESAKSAEAESQERMQSYGGTAAGQAALSRFKTILGKMQSAQSEEIKAAMGVALPSARRAANEYVLTHGGRQAPFPSEVIAP